MNPHCPKANLEKKEIIRLHKEWMFVAIECPAPIGRLGESNPLAVFGKGKENKNVFDAISLNYFGRIQGAGSC